MSRPLSLFFLTPSHGFGRSVTPCARAQFQAADSHAISRFAEAAPVPTSIIHGWRDELIPATAVIDWAAARNARLLLVDDAHRLAANVETSGDAFAALLASL